VDDHTSPSGVRRYMLGREPLLTPDGQPITDAIVGATPLFDPANERIRA